MSKLSNMLLMVFQLQKGGIQSVHQLANLLEVTPRQIRRYRDELEMSGIYICSKTGKHGGYYMNKYNNQVTQSSNLTNVERLISLIFENEKVLAIKDILETYQYMMSDANHDVNLLKKYPLNQLPILFKIMHATIHTQVLKITYLTSNENVIERLVQPYFTFSKHGHLYLAAYHQRAKRIIYLRFTRMIKIQPSKEVFTFDQERMKKEKEIVQINQGVFYQKHLIEVKLKTLQEKKPLLQDIFNSQFETMTHQDDTMTVILKVGNTNEIKHHLLSLGVLIEVLQPTSLREEMISELKQSLSQYGVFS